YSDLKILETEIKKAQPLDDVRCEYSVLKKLAHTVRENEGQVEVILFKEGLSWTILDVVPHSSHKNLLGIACDIGTTTVALQVVDLQNGKILGSASSYNQQIRCGEDIISRINYAQKQERLKELHEAIASTINNLLEKAIKASGGEATDIYFASLTGNTTMIHLLLELDPRYIREEPYVPTLNRVPILRARDLHLNMNKEARVHCAPSVGSYVGGDILAGLLCTPMVSQMEKISVFVDIGTNGELVLGNKEWLMSCACSAGPAFEGGGTRCGMPATTGAIEKLKIQEDGTTEYGVIGGGKPKGICGSGLIDLLSELFVHGYVDRHGKFNVEKVGDRLVDNEKNKGFLVETGTHTFWGKALFITENDIANLIRTKGAVFSACSLLLKHAGLSFDQIESFYIAGGFGQNLDVENAIRIGLLPDLERTKFHYLGNTSLLGAHLILLSEKNRERVNELEKMMTYLELNTEPGYFNEYTGALFLPHTKKELFPSVERLLSR
ncbi:MAG: ASKHA domain-containing protein, partial [Candidatus Aminicenantes bacterium]